MRITWLQYRYVSQPSHLMSAAVLAVILIIAGVVLTNAGRAARPSGQTSRRAPGAWLVGIVAALAASILVIAPQPPTAVLPTLTILVVEAAAVIAIMLWSRRPG
jgi:hypothetical protein